MDSINPSDVKKKRRPGAIIAVIIVIIVIGAAVAVLKLDQKQTTTLVILVGSGSMTQQYISMVATEITFTLYVRRPSCFLRIYMRGLL